MIRFVSYGFIVDKMFSWAICRILLGVLIASIANSDRARGGTLTLDLTSGVRSNELGNAYSGGFDTYREQGFTIQVETAGNHMDEGYSEGFHFHDGGANVSSPNNIRLTFAGGNFSLSGFSFGSDFSSTGPVTFTGSDNSSFTYDYTAGGGELPLSFVNVSYVSMSNNNSGNVFLSSFTVEPAPAVPEPSMMVTATLLGLGGYIGKRRMKK